MEKRCLIGMNTLGSAEPEWSIASVGSLHGFAKGRFAPMREAFAANFASGADLGASFCVTVEGETVVDLWGGWADETRMRPWQSDTIVNVYSTTKTMTALVALLLSDRGELDFEAPVARYWPEFAANGKAQVKVSHLMSHSAGLPEWHQPITNDDLYDWEKVTHLLAAQAPDWVPGTEPGYHSVTFGYLVGEVVRRITGRSLGTVFRQEIAEPLGADFYIGLPASEDARVADLTPPPPDPRITLDVMATRTRAWRGAELPAIGGTGNARAIAEIHAILANGGVVKGKRFLSEAGCRKALEVQVSGRDRILGFSICNGLGFAVSGGVLSFPNPNTIYWGGYGGSLAVIDMDARTSLAYAMNKMPQTSSDMRGLGLAMAALRHRG
jgi:CubicO group peptidase (beta-lactamase class C family)